MTKIYTPPVTLGNEPELLDYRAPTSPTVYEYGEYEEDCEKFLESVRELARKHPETSDPMIEYLGSTLTFNLPDGGQSVYVLWNLTPLSFVFVDIRGGRRLPAEMEAKFSADMVVTQEERYEFLTTSS